MKPETIEAIQRLKPLQVAPAFKRALDKGNVSKDDWYTWQKVWSEGQMNKPPRTLPTGSEVIKALALDVFKEQI